MHVLIIPSWYPNSPGDFHGSFFREQATALADSGMRVGVLVLTPSPWYARGTGPSRGRRPTADVEEGLVVVRASVPQPFPKLRCLNTVAARRWIDRAWGLYVSRNGVPDVLHAHSLYPGAFFAHYLSRKHGIPFVYTEHRSLAHMPMHTPIGRATERHVAGSASARVAVSRGHASHLARRFGMPDDRWMYVPNLLPPAMSEAMPSTEGADTGAFVVGHLSSLDPIKSVGSLIQAFSDAFGDDPAAILRIGGDGEERARLEALAHRVPGGDRIEFLGRLDRDAALSFYGGIDVFVLPSTSEPMGVVLIEALSQGVPVIATRTWGGETVVTPGDGWLVPIGDEEALSDALLRARDARLDPLERQHIRTRCIERFGEDAFVERHRRIYASAGAQ